MENKHPIFWMVIGGMVAGAIASAFLAFAMSAARAHEAPSGWSYPAVCCSQRDCNMIPASRVSEGPEGYRVVLLPGDHEMVKAGASFLIPYSVAKQSPDGEFHICILPSGSVICFFVPPRGM